MNNAPLQEKSCASGACSCASESTAMTGRDYWRSLDELTEQPGFQAWLQREFPQGAAVLQGVNRRSFLRTMAASFGLAGLGLTGCRRPEHKVVAYSKRDEGMEGAPENVIPGLPVHYASAFPGLFEHLPIVVETHGNRPTHIEGNAKAPGSTGALPPRAVASVLDLYDPDRLAVAYRGQQRADRASVDDLLTQVHEAARANGGRGLALLVEPSTSPTRRRLQERLQALLPEALWAEYSPLEALPQRSTLQEIFGRPTRALPRLDAAKVILSLDADFLGEEPGSMAHSKGFADGRRVHRKEDAAAMNRLYVVESRTSVTGGMADHRLRCPQTQLSGVAALLAAEVLDQLGREAALATGLRERAQGIDVNLDWVRECARDLAQPERQGSALVLAGPQAPKPVQQLCVFLNAVLGATGTTVRYVEEPASTVQSLSALKTAIDAGEVDTLFILGGNPCLNAPAALDWGSTQAKVERVVRCGQSFDETALEADWVLPLHHYLEDWGDGRTLDGTYVPVQPMLQPLFDSFSELELLAALAGEPEATAYGLVLETVGADYASGGETPDRAFARILSRGFAEGSAYADAGAPSMNRLREALGADGASPAAIALDFDQLEVRLVPDYKLGDGTAANNGWLQELPDPVTKLTWDNALLISPVLAEKLGYDTASGTFLIGGGIGKRSATMDRGREVAPVAELTFDGRTLRGPVMIQPGLPDWTVVVPLGYGRRKSGRIGSGVGFDGYALLGTGGTLALQGAQLRLSGDSHMLANTQEHWSMEGRAIYREANSAYFEQHPDFVNAMGMESHSPPVYGKAKDKPDAYKALNVPRGASAYEHPAFGEPPPNYDIWQGEAARERFVPYQQWGMTIDLNVCTGCSACVTACQSENNIPVVGKDQVLRGRELHWMRLDRYYSTGDVKANRSSLPADPQMVAMPVTCLHCETAPCEQVCPVNATVHDRDGLNVMAYNRCVGTRYCANNCPYKVRRFNFFDYNKRAIGEHYLGPLGTNLDKTEEGQLKALQRNPDVSVRMRGVMEKCTFCVQRIQQAKMAQKVTASDSNDIHVPDGVIRTACQSACPTEAIAFGDVSDPDSEVSRLKQSPLNYSLLGYLNTRPRLTYLARLRNPNPLMPDYEAYPMTGLEYGMDKHGGDHGESHNGDHGDSHGHEDGAHNGHAEHGHAATPEEVAH